MTHPSNGRKLDQNEVDSIENAVKEAGIQQIHPDKMEAFADELVSRLKGAGKTLENLQSNGRLIRINK